MTIIEFLEGRIAEDETWARAAAPWATGSRHEGQPVDWSIHFDRWSPARVLAECAAKRAIIELADNDLRVEVQRGDASALGGALMHHDTLRALAAVHKDHPEFQEEWA